MVHQSSDGRNSRRTSPPGWNPARVPGRKAAGTLALAFSLGALGGVLIGVAENLSEGYIGRGMKEIAGFVLILVVLMVRPYGLFGKAEIERV